MPKLLRNLLVAAAITALAAGHASAQDTFPSRPITLVIPFAAGGNTDLTARIFATALSEELGQPVVADNRPGAAGTTAGGMVADAAPDGYTLLWSGSSLLAIPPGLYPDLSYDIATAFTPISRVMTHTLLIAVHSGVSAKSVEELIALAKAEPGALNYGSGGIGGLHHLTTELFQLVTETEMAHIPYQGLGPAVTDLMAGTVDVLFMGLPQGVPFKDDDSTGVRLVAVTSAERDPTLPDLPTLTELGYPQLEIAQSWYGVLGPAGLPADVLATLSEASKKAAMRPEVVEAAAGAGLTTVAESPEAFDAIIVQTREAWADLVERTGMTFE